VVGIGSGIISDKLEVQIEELADALERCRKTALASKAAVGLGGILVAATTLGVVTFDPMVMVAGLAALLGGVVVFGSNTSTANQLSESMRSAEAQRAALIGQLDIRLVEDAPLRHELQAYAGARFRIRLPAGARSHGLCGHRTVFPLQEDEVALVSAGVAQGARRCLGRATGHSPLPIETVNHESHHALGRLTSPPKSRVWPSWRCDRIGSIFRFV
jgi:hypothetical protein